MSAVDQVNTLARELLAEKLASCTESERAGFWRIFPPDKFPNGIPQKSVLSAIDLIDRTIASREKRKATP